MIAVLKRFVLFWYDFIVGDDWVIAVGVVAALALSGLLVRRGVAAWWLLPGAVAILLVVSLWRATRLSR
jgi:hypothetical protein